MRKLILSVLVLFFAATAMMAQADAQLKTAKKSFDSYSLNKDEAKLVEAVDNINKVMMDGTLKADAAALVEAGDIYSAVINDYVTTRSLAAATNPEGAKDTPKLVEQAAVKSANAYMTAYKNADPKKGKKYRKAALKGLVALQGNLSNEGIYAIQDQNYAESQAAFQASIMLHKFLMENGEESAMDDAKLLDEKYYAALSAMLNEDMDTAEPLYLELYEANYEEAAIYDGLYKIAEKKDDKAAAEKYLMAGREKYPENLQLLFTEINFLLANGRLDELTGKLSQAIEKEPNNVSLYATLGQVYERLYNQATKDGNTEEAAKNYDLARQQYEAGLQKDPEAARLIYSLGAMIYNRGAVMSQKLAELESDFSKEGQKKYDTLKGQVDAEFEAALPYFQKAEMADPSDLNTLIALKEMYARNSEFEVSNEFKTRIETLQGGGKIEKSYFKEKGM